MLQEQPAFETTTKLNENNIDFKYRDKTHAACSDAKQKTKAKELYVSHFEPVFPHGGQFVFIVK